MEKLIRKWSIELTLEKQYHHEHVDLKPGSRVTRNNIFSWISSLFSQACRNPQQLWNMKNESRRTNISAQRMRLMSTLIIIMTSTLLSICHHRNPIIINTYYHNQYHKATTILCTSTLSSPPSTPSTPLLPVHITINTTNIQHQQQYLHYNSIIVPCTISSPSLLPYMLSTLWPSQVHHHNHHCHHPCFQHCGHHMYIIINITPYH